MDEPVPPTPVFSLLCRLGLRQPNPWDPPTVLDRLLASPTRAAAHWLWTWLATVRRWRWRWQWPLWTWRPARPASAIRVVCLSDTHDQIVPDVPAGDLLVHAGDLTNHGTPAALRRQLDWLAALPHAHKVVVAGNHDTWFDPAARAAAAKARSDDDDDDDDDGHLAPPSQHSGVHYLEHTTATLAFANGRQVTVYGAPDIPRCGGDEFAFQYDRDTPPWKGSVPDDIDILVTHPPPRHHRDLGLGCAGLLQELWRVRPRLHVFGHVHWGAGRELLVWDAAQQAYETLLAAGDDGTPPLSVGRSAVLLGRLLAAAVAATLLVPVPLASSSSSTLLVNAAQMHGNTGRLGHNIQVVDI